MSEMMAAVPKDTPLMQEWEKFKATEYYRLMRQFALQEEHVDGALWAAFLRGWMKHREDRT